MVHFASDLRVAPLTVVQVHSMVSAGILREGEPLELIDGVLVYKDRSDYEEDPMTVGKRQNLVVKLLARLDAELAQLGRHMQTQGPLSIPPHDEPEPDGVVLRGEPRDYADRLTARFAEKTTRRAGESISLRVSERERLEIDAVRILP